MAGKYSFALSRRIMREHGEHGFLSCFLYGEQGRGKTTYGIKVLADIYGSYEEAMKYFFDNLWDLHRFLSKLREERARVPCIMIDEIGDMLDRYSWRTDKSRAFSRLYNLLRAAASGVIMTSVMFDDIIRAVRSKVMYRAKVNKKWRDGRPYAIVTGYRLYVYPDLTTYTRKEFVDTAYLDDLPDWLRQRLDERKWKLYDEALDELGLALEREKKRRERMRMERVAPEELATLLQRYVKRGRGRRS